MHIYVGVHHDPSRPAGPLITLATQAALSGGWVIGPTAPATHAYLVVEHGDGMRWRLDGRPGGARWSPAGGLVIDGLAAAVWSVNLPPPALMRICERARELDDVAYDWGEIAGQGAVALTRFLPRSARALAILGRAPWAADAAVCTRVVMESLSPVLPVTLPDLFPERLAQAFREMTGRVMTRVI